MYQNLSLFDLPKHYRMTGMDPGVIKTIAFAAQFAGGYFFRYYQPFVFCEWMSDGCDLFDPDILVRYAHRRAQLSVVDFGAAIEAIQSIRTPYLTSEEVDLRLAAADGSCPMCGVIIAFSRQGEFVPGMFTRVDMIRCDHFQSKHVSDPEIVRTPGAWTGGRWPYVKGELVATADGQPLSQERKLHTHCRGCFLQSVKELLRPRIRTFLAEWFFDSSEPELDRQQRGWLVVMTEELLRDGPRKYKKPDGEVVRIVSDGLQVLYGNGEATFSLRVPDPYADPDDDPDPDNPSFYDRANGRLRELGLTDCRSFNGALFKEEVGAWS